MGWPGSPFRGFQSGVHMGWIYPRWEYFCYMQIHPISPSSHALWVGQARACAERAGNQRRMWPGSSCRGAARGRGGIAHAAGGAAHRPRRGAAGRGAVEQGAASRWIKAGGWLAGHDRLEEHSRAGRGRLKEQLAGLPEETPAAAMEKRRQRKSVENNWGG